VLPQVDSNAEKSDIAIPNLTTEQDSILINKAMDSPIGVNTKQQSSLEKDSPDGRHPYRKHAKSLGVYHNLSLVNDLFQAIESSNNPNGVSPAESTSPEATFALPKVHKPFGIRLHRMTEDLTSPQNPFGLHSEKSILAKNKGILKVRDLLQKDSQNISVDTLGDSPNKKVAFHPTKRVYKVPLLEDRRGVRRRVKKGWVGMNTENSGSFD